MDTPRRLSVLQLFTVVAVLCLCMAGAVLLLQVQAQASAADWVTHTREVLQHVARAQIALGEAEASERGFLLSGDPSHAQRYEEARRVAGRQLRDLSALTQDNAKQQAVLAHLSSETERRMDMLRAHIEDRRRNPAAAASGHAPERTGLRTRLGGYLAQLEAEEERLLAERRAAALAARHGVAATAAGIVGLALALVLLLPAAAARQWYGRATDGPAGAAGPRDSLQPTDS
jgi:CHASE3 domain sensor protein